MDKKRFIEKAAAELYETMSGIDIASLEDLAADISSAGRIFITGAGRTLLMMRAFAMSLMQIGLVSFVVGDTTTPSITPSDLLIVASYSGKTKSTMLFTEEAKRYGAKIALLTAHPQSPMAKVADHVVVISSASDALSNKHTVQFEGNGFEHALVPLGDALIRFLCETTGVDEAVMLKNHANLE